MYATADDYENIFLLGRAGIIPLAEFPYWATQASIRIDLFTQDRLRDEKILERNRNAVKLATCALAEVMYNIESPDSDREISSESVGGHSVSYVTPKKEYGEETQYRSVVTTHLGNTGLLFRGVR